jgi:uncharacterized surface protein with fasciclin (FAS1) repeats
MRKLLAFLMVLSMMAVALVPVIAQDSNTITDIVVASSEADEPQFTVLLAAVQTSEKVLEALSNPDAELTVFAPTDEAFTSLLDMMEITAEDLLEQPELVEAILLYHVVSGAVPASAVIDLDGEEVPTLLGDFAPVTIEITEDDEVTLVDGVDMMEAGMEEDNTATVITADIEADNGIIHVIDSVLLPSDEMLEEHFAMMEDMMMGDMDDDMMSNTVADIVVASTTADEPQFTVLLAAVLAADPAILEALSNPDAELTVFAPTDEAFTALLEALDTDAETLLANTELLNSVLMYHVLDGAVMAETVLTLDGESVPTLLGEDATISITVTDDGVVLNDSINVIATDIEADNGVIHVIDGVLVPDMGE